MTSHSLGADVALRLLLREAQERGSPGALADAGERLFSRMDPHMSRWFGTDGYSAIVRRAVDRVRVAHPAVLLPSGNANGASESAAIVALRSVAGSEADDFAVLLLGTFISLLGRLVGEELAMGLIMQSWPDAGKRGPQAKQTNQ